MDVLLADVVAGKFGEVEPVLAEVGGVALVLVAPRDPRHVAVPVDRAAEDCPELALVERLLDEQIAALVAALRAAHDGELLLRRELRGVGDLRHNRGDDTSLDVAPLDVVDVEDGLQVDGVLKLGFRPNRRESLDEISLLIIDTANHNIRISDINR